MAGLPRATQMRRLTGALARKGYGAGRAFGVVRELLDDVEQEQDGPGELDGGEAQRPWGT